MAKSTNQLIREYLTKHPNAAPKDVALKLNCNPQYVYVVRSMLRKEAKNAEVAITPVPTEAPVPVEVPQATPFLMDLINKPPHYTDGGIETIDFIEAKGLDYNLGNVVKYVSRAGKKGDALHDLKKARWYLDRAIEKHTGAA